MKGNRKVSIAIKTNVANLVVSKLPYQCQVTLYGRLLYYISYVIVISMLLKRTKYIGINEKTSKTSNSDSLAIQIYYKT